MFSIHIFNSYFLFTFPLQISSSHFLITYSFSHILFTSPLHIPFSPFLFTFSHRTSNSSTFINFSTVDCIKGRGRFYQGKVNVTRDGLECQRWDSQVPHNHIRPPDVFPELKDAENYCRNAGGEEHIPWCFTTNASIRWGYCDIPKCLFGNSKSEIKENITMDKYLTPTFLLIVSGIGLLGVMVLMLLIVLCHRLHKHHLGYNPTDVQEVNIDLDKLPSNMAYHR